MSTMFVLGCRVDAVGRDEAVHMIASLANGSQPSLVVTLGVEMVMAARRDASFRAIVNASALSVCDTIGILLTSKLRRGPLGERVTGVDLVDALALRSAQAGDVRLFLLGGKPGVTARAAERLRARVPNVRIAGERDGYFSVADDEAVVASIAASGANVLLAGLGSPKQERWLHAHLAATGCGVGIGVGGSFDVIAGVAQRAPRIVQQLGCEWLYRLIREPSRWRRQLALPQFALAALGETIRSTSIWRQSD